MRMVHAQMTHDMSLLIIFYRAIRAFESRWFFALMTQMREHRFLPLVHIAATGTLVQAVSLIAWIRINFFMVPPPLGGTIWNSWKSGIVLVMSRSSVILIMDVSWKMVLAHSFTDKSWKPIDGFVKYSFVKYCYKKLQEVENVDFIIHK